MSAYDDKVAVPDLETGDSQSQHVGDKLGVSPDADKAAGFLLNTEGYEALTAEAEKRLKRKIDWFMVPMVEISVVFAYLLLLSSYSYSWLPLWEPSTRLLSVLLHFMV
jgi:hypothetical protein